MTVEKGFQSCSKSLDLDWNVYVEQMRMHRNTDEAGMLIG